MTRDDAPQDQGFVPNYLLYLLAMASETASGAFHARLRARGLRAPEWRVLACLYDHDAEMVTRLARMALAEQSRLTKILAQMEARDLLIRRGDPDDKRRVRVHLTEHGRKLAAELVGEARQHEAQVMRMLAEGEGARLKLALRALIDRLEPAQDPDAEG